MALPVYCLVLTLLGFYTFFLANVFGKEPEDTWKELTRVSGEERQKRLLSGAKAEGKALLYGNIDADHLERLRLDFERRYAGIKLEVWRASGEKTSNRVLTEARAGKYAVDVVAPSNEHLPVLMQAGLIGRYSSPGRNAYPDFHKDREGYWSSYDYNLAVIAYNSRLVSASEAPKKYEDFLNPKWKGDFALDMDPDKAVMGWLKSWGYEKTEKFMRALIKNDVVVRKGHTLLAQLLCAGEFKLALELYAYRVVSLKHEKGCPVEIVYPDPTPGAVTPLSIAKRAPHPYAAALLVDYIISEPAQRILAERGRLSGRRGIAPKYPDLDVEAKKVRLLLLRPEDAEQMGKRYQQLREEFILQR